MYRLYYSPGSASLAVHWMLILLGVPFELARVDLERGEQRTPQYLALNPAGRVPTLLIGERPYTETAALLMLLAERHPEAQLAPTVGSQARAEYLQWMAFFANAMQPAFRAWFYPAEIAGAGNAQAVQGWARDRVETAFVRLNALLADDRMYLLGPELTAADFLGTMLMRWSRNMPRPASHWPHLLRYIDRMRRMRSLREVHAREGLTDWISGELV